MTTHIASESPSVVVRGAGRYEVLLLLLVLVLLLAPFERSVLEPVIVALLSGVLLFALWTSSAPTVVVWLGAGLALGCIVTSAVAPVWSSSSKGAYALVSIILSLAAIVSIVTHLTQRRATTLTTLSGAVAIYLLVGLSFADLYIFLAQLAGTPFFAQPGPHDSVSYVYFSFTTLTTVGFGDLSAGTDPGRMLAVMEALLGQLYLVTVVAFIVASHRRERSER